MVSRRESDGEDSVEVDPESATEDAIKYGRAFLSVRHMRATTYDSSFFDGRYIWKPSVLFHRWAGWVGLMGRNEAKLMSMRPMGRYAGAWVVGSPGPATGTERMETHGSVGRRLGLWEAPGSAPGSILPVCI